MSKKNKNPRRRPAPPPPTPEEQAEEALLRRIEEMQEQAELVRVAWCSQYDLLITPFRAMVRERAERDNAGFIDAGWTLGENTIQAELATQYSRDTARAAIYAAALDLEWENYSEAAYDEALDEAIDETIMDTDKATPTERS